MDDRSSTSRADLHVHSEASQESRLGVQRSLGLPECAIPPEEAYELAKRRGMDFVTLTDHDTIAGADPEALGAAVAGLAADQPTRDRMARAAMRAVADRTWDRALARLAAGYRTALAPAHPGEVRHAA
jgi:glycosyltransferase involved in cell wall biosynthesis